MINYDYKWHVLYVTRHHEERAYNCIRRLGVEALLPFCTVFEMAAMGDNYRINRLKIYYGHLVSEICISYTNPIERSNNLNFWYSHFFFCYDSLSLGEVIKNKGR